VEMGEGLYWPTLFIFILLPAVDKMEKE